jgi:hypothetical protein
MPRFFNTTGPCKPKFHYMLPPTARLPNLLRLIDQANYFVIHAPRQTGKSTAMLALGEQLTATGKFTAVMVSVEVGQPFSHDTGKAGRAILGAWRGAAEDLLPEDLHPPAWPEAEPGRKAIPWKSTTNLSMGACRNKFMLFWVVHLCKGS